MEAGRPDRAMLATCTDLIAVTSHRRSPCSGALSDMSSEHPPQLRYALRLSASFVVLSASFAMANYGE